MKIKALFSLLVLCVFTGFKPLEEEDKPELIYVFDPLCGWCYGFSPAIQQLQNDYKDKVTFRIMSGGLSTSDKPLPEEAVAYITQALGQVEKKSGVPFGEKYIQLLKDSKNSYSSLPPSIAVSVVKEMNSDIAFEYAISLQEAIFHEGMSPNDDSTYTMLAQKHRLEEEVFFDKFNTALF
ncbi:DsbA family protein [Cytophagaceae bacterium ABcell3]|nr:DsbA family protein [Cytophagaceae bacterium ABcell3]